MFIGNTSSQQLLKSYLDIFSAWAKSAPSFYTLSGPEHIGKSSYAAELLKDYLGAFGHSDLLHIKDFSAELGKKHSLKIEYDKWSETSKTLSSDFQYQDLGIREINARLQQSSIGKMKVLLIENIERIVPAAANAFLKTCEEPLPGRLIIATTSHRSQLLDTIISRALVIHFNELSTQELLQFADEQKLFVGQPVLKELVCDMALGKPGMLIHLHDLLSKDEALTTQFVQIIPLLTKWTHLFQAQDIFKNFKKNGIRETFLDGRIAYCTRNDLDDQAKRRMKVKKMMKSTVNVEHLMLYGLLDK
jgi:hypothetical protein